MNSRLEIERNASPIVATAIRNFAWFFPRLPELKRLADAVDRLSDEDLGGIEARTLDIASVRSRRAHILPLIAPAAAASWHRNHPAVAGTTALLDAALALAGRKALPWGSLLWPAYYLMVAPAAMCGSLSWLHTDQTVTDISPW